MDDEQRPEQPVGEQDIVVDALGIHRRAEYRVEASYGPTLDRMMRDLNALTEFYNTRDFRALKVTLMGWIRLIDEDEFYENHVTDNSPLIRIQDALVDYLDSVQNTPEARQDLERCLTEMLSITLNNCERGCLRLALLLKGVYDKKRLFMALKSAGIYYRLWDVLKKLAYKDLHVKLGDAHGDGEKQEFISLLLQLVDLEIGFNLSSFRDLEAVERTELCLRIVPAGTKRNASMSGELEKHLDEVEESFDKLLPGKTNDETTYGSPGAASNGSSCSGLRDSLWQAAGNLLNGRSKLQ